MLDKTLNAPIITELRHYHLFKAMDVKQFDQLLMISRLRSVKTDQLLFQHGSTLTHLYYVFDGAIKLCRSTRKGNEKIIEVVQAGKSFGEGVLFEGSPKYPVSAVAMKASIVVSIDAMKYLNILKESNSLCIYMLGHLSQRLHWMLKELDKQTLHNASFRIIDYFLSQVEAEEDSVYDLCLTIPKRDIASRLSIKPETLSRTLKSLLGKDLIGIEDNHIILKDVQQLREMVKLEEI
ncbi:MAG TPA: Crp/Fnr family transcriptional regulator [Oceanospirillales bacterium]|nr:Crp/Fnr family transcriptional regulator [Oceanospirillales bacterium]